jgi:NAD(P)H-hydrate epimerase
MIPVLTAAEMRAVDRRAIETLGIPGPQLMENAGAGAAALVADAFAPIRGRRVLVVCGKGNNGGDGFVVARRLKAQGALVEVALVARRSDVRGDAAVALSRWRGPVRELVAEGGIDRLGRELEHAEVVVDGLLGTGLAGPAGGLAAAAIETINAAGCPVVSLDVPSGVAADSGTLPGPAIRATYTVTFAGFKPCLVLFPAAAHAGRVVLGDIGVDRGEVARGIATFLIEEPDVRRWFPPRPADAHKGTFGHLLVVAGSTGKTGAAALAGRAALRSGVGLCTIAAPASQQPIVAALGVEYMTEPLADTGAGTLSLKARERIVELAARVDAVALGPGLSTDPETQELVRALVAEVPRPMVIDADGLNALAGHLPVLAHAAGPRILTPHPGEMARLLGDSTAHVQANRLDGARAFALRHRVVLLLKGARTVIAAPDGGVFVNPTGNPGMASGGSGDVLTGLTGALLARGLDALTAAQAGCFLHGHAGDLVASRRGEEGMIAGDLVEAIPEAFRPSRAAAGPVRPGDRP